MKPETPTLPERLILQFNLRYALGSLLFGYLLAKTQLSKIELAEQVLATVAGVRPEEIIH
ncbi:hypothetical protein AUG19_01660 [archaeon 13_1_20CM_2_54_9]|nr:MAG: hypothetical protein AUG19_01660 [archaeon 13_1_20CM_2_54_9]